MCRCVSALIGRWYVLERNDGESQSCTTCYLGSTLEQTWNEILTFGSQVTPALKDRQSYQFQKRTLPSLLWPAGATEAGCKKAKTERQSVQEGALSSQCYKPDALVLHGMCSIKPPITAHLHYRPHAQIWDTPG